MVLAQQPLIVRLYQYQIERFPVMVILLSSLVVAGSSLAVLDAKLSWWRLAAGFVTIVLFPFHMRLADELKDYEHDLEHYPTRPVPRGLISLAEVKRVLFLVILIELLLNLWWGMATFLSFIVALAYFGLASKEFFIRKWLREHFYAYLALHQVQLAFMLPYLYLLLGAKLSLGNSALIAHFFMIFTLLFLVEWARKMRREEDEVSSRDTYSARLGRSGATIVFSLLVIVATVLFVFIARTVYPGGEVWGWLICIVVLAAGFGYARNLYQRSDIGVQLAALVLMLVLNGLISLAIWM